MKGPACPALFALLLVACGPSDRSPEGTVQLYLKAAAAADTDQIFSLLAPENQQRLSKLAQMASAQTGGSQTFKPQEMLVTGLTTPSYRPGEISVLRQDQARASVKILSRDKKSSEVLQLVREDGRWRILLPYKGTADSSEGSLGR